MSGEVRGKRRNILKDLGNRSRIQKRGLMETSRLASTHSVLPVLIPGPSSATCIIKTKMRQHLVILLCSASFLLSAVAAVETAQVSPLKPSTGQYAIHVRPYIPFDELAKIPGFPPYRGDKRGPSTSPDVTSRINLVVVVDFAQHDLPVWKIWSDPSHQGERTAVAKPDATVVHVFRQR